MSPRVIINATRCVEYLRKHGIDISPITAQSWLQQEQTSRAQKRRHNVELKRTCGHFNRHTTQITHANGVSFQIICSDCWRILEMSGASVRAPIFFPIQR